MTLQLFERFPIARQSGALGFLLALVLLPPFASSRAADIKIYECKSALAISLGNEIAGDDTELGAAMGAFTAHNVYKFDFADNTVTFRLLNNKGKEYGALGMGAVSKYTAEIQVKGDEVRWVDPISECPDGTISAQNTFNLKSGKLHVATTIRPASGESPQSMDEESTCTTYAPNKQ